MELLPDIRKYGFAIEYQKDGSFNITATPNEMNSDDAQIILEDLLFELNQTNFNSPSPKSQKIALTMAKRLSIKEGKQLQDEEMLGIVGQLFSSSNCEISPFGKKIIHKLEMEEIDNIFG